MTGDRPLRIAAHNGAPEWGGAEIATSLLLAGLQERGHDVVLFYNREVVARGAAAHGLRVRSGYLGGDIALHHALRFALQLRRLRPDVLLVGTFRKLWLAALAARIAGVPVVARIGLSTDVPRNAKYRWVFRHLVQRVVTNADDLRDAYRRALPDAPPPAVETIHKGIALGPTRRTREETLQDLGLSESGPVVGAVGRLVEQKRFDRLLRAFASVPGQPALLVVGDGPLRPRLESLARELRVNDRTRFVGHRNDIPDIMAALDLLVISSDRESLANVMLEAMAAGVPVVSTPVSGAREALEGTIPPAGVVVDSESLGEAIEALLADADRRQALASAAARRAADRFAPERMLDEWERELRAASGSVESEMS